MTDNKKRALWVNGYKVPVTEQVYKAYCEMKRREKYLIESDNNHGKVNYHALDTDKFSGEEILTDSSRNVENEAILHILADKLIWCMDELNQEERFLVDELFYKQKSVVKLAKEIGVPRKTLSYRRDKILDKLRRLIEKN